MDSRVMTNTYRQLTLDQRYQIQSDKAAGFSATETANRIGCHRSTVYRELKRCPGSSYGARRAQKASDLRRTCAYKHTKFSNQLWVRICRNIEAELSPEMIACRMPLEGISEGVSTSTLYRWLRWDYQQGGTVHQHLQRAFKPYKRAYGLKRWRNRYRGNPPIFGALQK
jgi:transposase, IS30 family